MLFESFKIAGLIIWDDSNLHQDRDLLRFVQASRRHKTYDNWAAALRGTGILRRKRFPYSVSRILYTYVWMNYFDRVFVIATDVYVYDLCLSSYAPKSISNVGIDTALEVNFLVFDCLGPNSCYY